MGSGAVVRYGGGGQGTLNCHQGFTLMEMLIVVAIIAVLVAIAIPVFMTQLETSREATDSANIRSAYAEVMAAYLTDNKEHTAKVDLQSDTSDWKSSADEKIAGVSASAVLGNNATSPIEVKVSKAGEVTIGGQKAVTSFQSSGTTQSGTGTGGTE